MEIPIAVIIYILGAITGMVSLCGHLLLKVYGTVNEIRTSQKIFQTRAEARIRMLFKGPSIEDKEDNSFWGDTK